MEDKYKIIIPTVIIIALFGTFLVLFTKLYSDIDSDIVASLESVTINNVTSQETFTSGTKSNTTNVIINHTSGDGRLIRNTPSLTCTKVFIYHNLSGGVSPTPRGMRLSGGSFPGDNVNNPDFTCNVTTTGEGRLWLRLHGNATNNTNPVRFNVSYTAKVYGGAWNVSMEQRQALGEAGSQTSTYYSLLILAVILAVVLAYTGFRMSSGGGFGGGEGGGFSLSSITDKFER